MRSASSTTTTRSTTSKTPHPQDDVNTSSELRPGPERASRTPTNDGATTTSSRLLTSSPGTRLAFSCGWHITRNGRDVYLWNKTIFFGAPRSARRTRCRHTWASALWGCVPLPLVGASPPPGDASLLLALHRGQTLLALPRQHQDDLWGLTGIR